MVQALGEYLAHDLSYGDPADAFRRVVCFYYPQIRVHRDDRILDTSEYGFQAGAMFGQFSFCLFATGNIATDRSKPGDHAFCASNQRNRVLDDSSFTIISYDFINNVLAGDAGPVNLVVGLEYKLCRIFIHIVSVVSADGFLH